MDRDLSSWKKQERGVRQGCTLSPLLFIISLSVLMSEVEGDVKREHPLGLTPVFAFPDVEYADDTVIIAKVAHVASFALASLQRRAAPRGLFLNKSKTKELVLNSDLRVTFLDGSLVPTSDRIRYLGTIIRSNTDLGPEIASRVAQAEQAFKKLQLVWRHKGLSQHTKIRIYNAC
eukprot:13116224-Alexandrium_andersonii.AAC.1